MNPTITVELPITSDLVSAVAAEVAKSINDELGAPITPEQLFQKMGGAMSKGSIYREIRSGSIRTVEGVSKILIPAKEVERLLA